MAILIYQQWKHIVRLRDSGLTFAVNLKLIPLLCVCKFKKKNLKNVGLSVFRCYCSATLLHGKVVVVGGYDGQSLLSSLEEYDEANNTWTVKTNMPTARCDAGFAIIKYRNFS